MQVEANYQTFLARHAETARANQKKLRSQRTAEVVAPALVLLACTAVTIGCALRWPEPGLWRTGAIGIGTLSAGYAIGGTLRYRANSRKIAALQTRIDTLNQLITGETDKSTIRDKLPADLRQKFDELDQS